MDILIWFAILIVSLAVLLISADYFTDYSKLLGMYLHMPDFLIGIIILAIGTSLPELITSVFAVLEGSTEFVAGNVIGSNITNILLIIGLSSIIAKELKVERDLVEVDLPILLGSAFVLSFTAYDGLFTYKEGIICILSYGIYLGYCLSMHREQLLTRDNKNEKEFSWIIPIVIVASTIGIYYGAEYTIKSVIKLSELFKLPNTSIIALSAVASGTSLPELVVSISAGRKKNYELALGNVLGSNVFNSSLVIGIPSFFADLQVSPATISIGIPFMIIATITFVVACLDNKVSKYEGAMFIFIYILFMGKLFGIV